MSFTKSASMSKRQMGGRKPTKRSWEEFCNGEQSEDSDDAQVAAINIPPSNAEYMNICFDPGTTKTSGTFQLHGKGDTHIPPIKLAELSEDELDSPMIVMYDDNDNLHEGNELVRQLEDGLLEEEDVLRFSKLALQPDADNMDIFNKVSSHLNRHNKTIEDMWADYLGLLLVKVRAYIKRGPYGDVDDVPFHLYICFPQIWSPATLLALVAAGKRVGALTVKMVSEPLCAAASILHYAINADQGSAVARRLRESHMVVVADLGGGTADFVVIQLCSRPAGGPGFAIRVVRPETGNLAGARQINRKFTRWLVEDYLKTKKRLEREARMIGCTADQFLEKCSAAFESIKLSFPGRSTYNFIVSGNVGGTKPAFMCQIQKSTMESFFDPVIQDIGDLLKRTISSVDDPDAPQHVKAIILCGGLSSSSYVRSKLEDRFRRIAFIRPLQGFTSPASKGGLLRYSLDLQYPVGHNWSLCCIRNEEWNPLIHHDATVWKKKANSISNRKRPFPRLEVAKNDPDGEYDWVVEDRCVFILDGTTNQVKPKWSVHYWPVTGPDDIITITAEIFWTLKPDPTDHEPLRVDGGQKLRPCFEHFRTVTKTFPASEYNFKQIRLPDGSLKYRIHTCVTVRPTMDKLEAGILICEENDMDLDEDILDESYMPPEDQWNGQVQEIWDEKNSHLSQEVSGLNSLVQRSGHVTPSM